MFKPFKYLKMTEEKRNELWLHFFKSCLASQVDTEKSAYYRVETAREMAEYALTAYSERFAHLYKVGSKRVKWEI